MYCKKELNKSVMRALRWLLWIIFLLPICYLLLAVFFGLISVNENTVTHDKEIKIYIGSNGVHADFILPLAHSKVVNWKKIIPVSDFEYVPPWTSHIAFGWGDKGFYTETPNWSDLKFETVMGALFLRKPSVMHVSYVNNPMANPNPVGKSLILSPEQYEKLVFYILNSFRKNEFDHVIHVPIQGYDRNDTFYEAKGSYSLKNTCNEWIGKGLRQIGVKMGRWTPSVQSVFFHLE